jgi:spore germination cell wall hydrolase CwlJ-like protein
MKLEWLLWLTSLLPQPLAEHTCLATTIYLEARSESTLGQMAVAEVVMRRQESGRWGETVCAVVNARGQFAQGIVSRNYLIKNPKAWVRSWSIAAQTLRNWSLPPLERKLVVPSADHFYAQNIVSPSWGDTRLVAVIGGHSFVRVL